MSSGAPAPLPHLGLLLELEDLEGTLAVTLEAMTCVSEGDHTEGMGAAAYLPSMSLVMYDAGFLATLAGTLGSVTSVSTGKVVVGGTSAKTLASLTLSSSGTAGLVTGSLDAPVYLPHMAFVLYGYAGINCQTNKTLEDMTCVSEADAPGNEIWAYEDEDKPARPVIYWPHSRNVDWFQTDTVLRSDTGGLFGVVGQSLQALSRLIIGSVNVGATLTNTLGTLTADSDGTVLVTGTLTKTLGTLTSVSAVSVDNDVVGTLFESLDTLTAVGVGSPDVGGTLAKTLDNVTCFSTTVGDITGTLSKTLQGINFNIDGSVLSGFVCVVIQTMEGMTCDAVADNGARGRKDAGGVKGRGNGNDKVRRFYVKIDDDEFFVDTEEEAAALIEAAREMAETVAKAQATAKIKDRVTEKSVDTSPVDLDLPKIMSDDPEVEQRLKDAVNAVYERAERDAEIALHMRKQHLLDEEDNLVLLLLD